MNDEIGSFLSNNIRVGKKSLENKGNLIQAKFGASCREAGIPDATACPCGIPASFRRRPGAAQAVWKK